MTDTLCDPRDHVQPLSGWVRVRNWAAYLVTTFLVVIGAVYAGHEIVDALRWDPLGEYPQQVVSSPNQEPIEVPADADADDPGIPTLYWDQKIEVLGRKCVKESEDQVTVEGTLAWVSDRPPGVIVPLEPGGGGRGPACVDYPFANEIEEPVLAKMREMKAEGAGSSVWHITGIETPVRSNGETGVTRTWRTATFRVIHRDAP